MAAEALPYGLDVAGGERLRFSGAEVLIKASAETTGGSFSIVEEISPLDTPRHVHEREDELFFVLDGTLLLDIRDDHKERTHELAPRQGMVVPKGVVHRTRAPERTAILMAETAGVRPTGD
jgi:mannose-6-phosphate isomerase-like protein (cupin superfamily)